MVELKTVAEVGTVAVSLTALAGVVGVWIRMRYIRATQAEQERRDDFAVLTGRLYEHIDRIEQQRKDDADRLYTALRACEQRDAEKAEQIQNLQARIASLEARNNR